MSFERLMDFCFGLPSQSECLTHAEAVLSKKRWMAASCERVSTSSFAARA